MRCGGLCRFSIVRNWLCHDVRVFGARRELRVESGASGLKREALGEAGGRKREAAGEEGGWKRERGEACDWRGLLHESKRALCDLAVRSAHGDMGLGAGDRIRITLKSSSLSVAESIFFSRVL